MPDFSSMGHDPLRDRREPQRGEENEDIIASYLNCILDTVLYCDRLNEQDDLQTDWLGNLKQLNCYLLRIIRRMLITARSERVSGSTHNHHRPQEEELFKEFPKKVKG